MEYKYAYETLANRDFVDMLRSGFDDAGNRLLYTRADLAKLGEKVDITEYVELVNGIFGREKIAYAHPEIEYITLEQQNTILSHIPERYRPIFQFMMEYGCRPGEARALQKDCIVDKHIIIRRAF